METSELWVPPFGKPWREEQGLLLGSEQLLLRLWCWTGSPARSVDPLGPQAVCHQVRLAVTGNFPSHALARDRDTPTHRASWFLCGQWLQPRSWDRAFGFLRTRFNGPFSMWGHVPVRGTGKGGRFTCLHNWGSTITWQHWWLVGGRPEY